VQLVPKQVATQKLADIGKEQAILSSLLLEWECPRPGTALVGYIPPIAQTVPGSEHGHSLPPVFPSFDMNWKIRTTPKTKGRDTLDVPLWEVTSHSGSTSSSSRSSCQGKRPSLGWTTKPPFYSEANLAARPEQKCGCLPFPLARTEHLRGEGWCSPREPKNPGGCGYTPSISCRPALLV
jgi:hypothetical protein